MRSSIHALSRPWQESSARAGRGVSGAPRTPAHGSWSSDGLAGSAPRGGRSAARPRTPRLPGAVRTWRREHLPGHPSLAVSLVTDTGLMTRMDRCTRDLISAEGCVAFQAAVHAKLRRGALAADDAVGHLLDGVVDEVEPLATQLVAELQTLARRAFLRGPGNRRSHSRRHQTTGDAMQDTATIAEFHALRGVPTYRVAGGSRHQGSGPALRLTRAERHGTSRRPWAVHCCGQARPSWNLWMVSPPKSLMDPSQPCTPGSSWASKHRTLSRGAKSCTW